MNLELPTADFEGELTFPLPSSSQRAAPQGLLKRLSARHHKLAQCLGEGMAPGDAAVVCGYTAARVSVLQTDHAFKDLISFYSAKRQEAFVSAGQKMAQVAETSLDIILDRLEETPESFTNGQLLAVATASADRSGLGPTTTQRNVTVNLTLDDLARIKARALATQSGVVKLLPAQSESERGVESPKPDLSSPAEVGLSPEGPPLRAGGREGAEELDPGQSLSPLPDPA